MHTKRFVLACLAAFIFIFCWGWLYNGVLMRGAHAEVMNLFRPREDTMGLFYWIIVGQAVIALAFVITYASGKRERRGRSGLWLVLPRTFHLQTPSHSAGRFREGKSLLFGHIPAGISSDIL